MKKKYIIGTRTSDLALWQANFIKDELSQKFPEFTFELHHIKTKGDKILDVALSKIGDKGLFTKELESALLAGDIDIAVHSLKDLQTDIPAGLRLAAVTKRHSVEDVLIARKKGNTISNLKEGAVVATGSLRRRSQLARLRPDIRIEELRGNVPTRINKFKESDWDAIILARAGVERLQLQEEISSIISLDELLPAVGQGALGIEIRGNDNNTFSLVSKLDDPDTNTAVTAERAFLKSLEGGCQVPIGAYCFKTDNGFILDGFVGSIDGTYTFRKRRRGSGKKPVELGHKLASDMIEAGAGEVLAEIYGKRSEI
ncbi:MAG: hydroxymethylbilane synthase [Ignavibacteriales bacterium]|nr:hydroxymethylbilane synthase [Ignavibacteriales bacterium]MCF8306233.1 hydroxymethylbilane synthase [Ignavibacteriales bacterium]MCF8315954.1 hydroxymethylbilane synthase [Ignavibacteriales bacterium]MCF8437548.1 hydroxymethylbilane synthase [Ignavibacteriales bacterium]